MFYLCSFFFSIKIFPLNWVFMLCCLLERQNHARELISEISLHEWDGIVIASGDGLLHEVLLTYEKRTGFI